ncbi:LOW QUALITY PROTEIN: granulin b [Brachionichthys hirsutus]|uniref:LOW QUALITY PROTEIN: granulin b n=1 Tax=Brachionichthys hirsutus TaxID=412623 RepID=UPI003605357B
MTLHMGVLLLALLGLSTALVCPDGGMCEDRSTCCKNTVGEFGCCPLPNAECCSDHLHCCYEGTVCDLVHYECLNQTVSLPWRRRLPTKQSQLIPHSKESVKAVLCPDQESECPDETTCCQLPDGSWGCCPLPKGICCEDKLHCCPEGSKCDISHSKCVSPSLQSIPMLEKLPPRRRGNSSSSTVTAVSCPGGQSSCPDSFTCCLLKSGEYGCCPYPEAICCSDLIHCCPGNTICDLEHGVCRAAEVRLPLLKTLSAAPEDVMCPDKTTSCPDQTTCCPISEGAYGCCPMPDAVCCLDFVHCCPAGTKCDLSHSTCVSSTREEANEAAKIPAAATEMVAAQRVFSVHCNESVVCADGNTCCELSGGEWACCPLPKAVCCEDRLHCCPHGTICNLEASTCDDPTGNAVIPWFTKTPAVPLPTDGSKCDESTSCPGNSTCCKSASGQWVCCPLPRAVCCDDQVHCCRHGTICNLASGTCDDPPGLLPSLLWVSKVSAVTSAVQNGKCDEQTMCLRGTTCCRKESGLWACCPLPEAVCCNDHEHCCPDGYKCNVAEQTCDKPAVLSLPWLPQLPALSVPTGPSAATDIKCDGQTSCPSGTTCCKLQTGKWGCCPLDKAVCCADRAHCCPQGYVCNMQSTTCEKKHGVSIHTLLQSKVVQSKPPDGKGDASVPCDGTGGFYCPERDTCCKISASAWACCPSPGAVCCSDSKRCCPAGHSCDLQSGGCTLQSRLTWDTFFRDREKDFK